MKSCFITFEGPEGCGKSTQLAMLAERLRSEGHEVVTTREPGGTPLGEAVRAILQHDAAGQDVAPQSETLLFEASRAQLVEHVIRPALQRGAVVLCDRFADSTTAYQGYGRGFDLDTLMSLHRFAVGETWPDVTILLDVDVEVGLNRLQDRKGKDGQPEAPDRMERECLAFHHRVMQGFRDMAQRWPERIRRVDGTGDVHCVHARIWDSVKAVVS